MSQHTLFRLVHSVCLSYQLANCCCVLALQLSSGHCYSRAVTGATDRKATYVKKKTILTVRSYCYFFLSATTDMMFQLEKYILINVFIIM